MVATATVALPGGLWRTGQLAREAELRTVTGGDEAFLVDEGASLRPAERSSALLARCVEQIGAEAVDDDVIRSLTVGDREALLLHLRRLTFGDALSCTVVCPDADCGERMELELSVSSLVLTPYADVAEWHDATVDGLPRRFRLPTGADQEAAAELALADLDGAVELVVRRCLDGSPDTLSAEGVEEVARLMAELDPQADILLRLTCPKCARDVVVRFDAGDYLFRELGAQRETVYEEIHHLAFHYGWSEGDVMAMTSKRRRLYLGILADALGAAAAG